MTLLVLLTLMEWDYMICKSFSVMRHVPFTLLSAG